MNYHYSNASNQTIGPCTEEQMRELYQMGTLRDDSWVIEEGATEWKPYASLFPPVTLSTEARESAKGGDWGNVFISGIVSGVIFATANLKNGVGAGFIAGGVAYAICIQNRSFRFNLPQKITAVVIMLVIGFHSQEILAFIKECVVVKK